MRKNSPSFPTFSYFKFSFRNRKPNLLGLQMNDNLHDYCDTDLEWCSQTLFELESHLESLKNFKFHDHLTGCNEHHSQANKTCKYLISFLDYLKEEQTEAVNATTVLVELERLKTLCGGLLFDDGTCLRRRICELCGRMCKIAGLKRHMFYCRLKSMRT